jgi:ubiquinone/menaquinone biosynthesis C-methylase UbiE
VDRDEYARMYALEDSYWWFVGKRRMAEALISQHVPEPGGLTVLDVGCGTGGFLSHWHGGREGGGPTVGLDFSSEALDFARQRHLDRLTQGSASTLPYVANSFDLVTALDLLYHRWVPDDVAVLRECCRVLRPGGWLLVTDSAFQFLYCEHDVRFWGQRRYTAGALRARVEAAGMTIFKLSYASSLLFPAIVAVRLWSRAFGTGGAGDSALRPLPRWLNGLLIGIYTLEAGGLRWLSYPFGSTVVCLARKSRDLSG